MQYLSDHGWPGPGTRDPPELIDDHPQAHAGQRHTGLNVIVTPAMSLDTARKKGAKLRRLYPVGRELRIAYNPERPTQCEIADDTQQSTNYGLILIGTLFFIFFGYLTYWAITNW